MRASLHDLLADHDRIDGTRIGTPGISIGAALEPRVAAAAQLCMLASIEGLIETGVPDRHGLYLSVSGRRPHLTRAMPMTPPGGPTGW